MIPENTRTLTRAAEHHFRDNHCKVKHRDIRFSHDYAKGLETQPSETAALKPNLEKANPWYASASWEGAALQMATYGLNMADPGHLKKKSREKPKVRACKSDSN